MSSKSRISGRSRSQSRTITIAVLIVISLCVLWITAVVNILMISNHAVSTDDITTVISSNKETFNRIRSLSAISIKNRGIDRISRISPTINNSKNTNKENSNSLRTSSHMLSNEHSMKIEEKDKKIAANSFPTKEPSVSLKDSISIRLKGHKTTKSQDNKLKKIEEKNKKIIISSSNRNLSVKKTEKISRITTLKKEYELHWPPVQQNGNISTADGFDVMPITGLKVPRFWAPKPSEDINKIGTRVNKLPTIFMMIASYRDYQCHETITSAFQRSDHPERLFVGAVQQDIETDIPCTYTEVPCNEDPSQPICKYRNQISVYRMDATMATGPVTARHIGDRLYRGQYFVTQMDAHCVFVNHWDTLLIAQWQSTRNEMAVLTSYLTDLQGSIDVNGDSTRSTRPIMCSSDFEGEGGTRHLRHLTQPESYPSILDMPQLEPFWAAGFSFSRGHFKVRVPYDAYQPMVFQGEEISIGVRGFSHGYDYYAPSASVVFHEYAEASARREKVPTFWENSELHVGEAERSLKRSMSIIKLTPGVSAAEWDHTEDQRYGLGKVRDVGEFYRIFLIDPINRTAVPLCPFVNPGIMHKDFVPHLRPDGLGIDYERLRSYDTWDFLSRVKTEEEGSGESETNQ